MQYYPSLEEYIAILYHCLCSSLPPFGRRLFFDLAIHQEKHISVLARSSPLMYTHHVFTLCLKQEQGPTFNRRKVNNKDMR